MSIELSRLIRLKNYLNTFIFKKFTFIIYRQIKKYHKVFDISMQYLLASQLMDIHKAGEIHVPICLRKLSTNLYNQLISIRINVEMLY